MREHLTKQTNMDTSYDESFFWSGNIKVFIMILTNMLQDMKWDIRARSDLHLWQENYEVRTK